MCEPPEDSGKAKLGKRREEQDQDHEHEERALRSS
jgi:hypothetical protein